MKPFITQVLEKLLSDNENISNIIFILPSKRAGSFLLNELSKISRNYLFSPKIFSIEEFIEEVSGLKTIDNTLSLFEFYTVYKAETPLEEQEPFETFITWAQSLLHDFNEVDRYLIDYNQFFNYLSEIKDQEHWFLQPEKTILIENYLKFWHKLPQYYEALKSNLLSQKKGYQGLIYRRATEKIKKYVASGQEKHVFIGFNALNAAEQEIFQYMLKQDAAEVFWDLDELFLEDKQHDASLFLNQYRNNWPYYQEHNFPIENSGYSDKKEISLLGVSKNIGQAKYAGQILAKLNPEELEKTAVVLGEEDLLLPLLNSLPENIKTLNITMGFPLKNAPISSLIDQIFKLQSKKSSKYYYKEVIAILQHPSLNINYTKETQDFISKIQHENLVYIEVETLLHAFKGNSKTLIKACFKDWQNSPNIALASLQNLIYQLKQNSKTKESTSSKKLELEFLYHFHVLFNKLSTLLESYPKTLNLKSLQSFYKEIMSTESLDFQGKPFKGLQLMGMLESRALDFEHVIICSVNEGVLPSGKSEQSFIPYDLKKAYQLPTYKEKDAVYTYHFYRLLQKAKKIDLLYNTESSGLNAGEKSRFITQLEIEQQPAHLLTLKQIISEVPKIGNELREIKKTPAMLEKLKSIAASGFSPSALTTYIRNPIDFYHQYLLGVRNTNEEVEETVAYNTLGTVIHDSLQHFYETYEGKEISSMALEGFQSRIDEEIKFQFENTYTKAPMDSGKNLLIFEVAKRYLKNFFKLERQRIKKGEKIKILQIERKMKAQIPVKKLDFPVYLAGKVDRAEESNGISRIIDYKTGKVLKNQIEIVDWENITTDYNKYSKSFQILAYALLMQKQGNLNLPMEAGIISFKNLKEGLMRFTKIEKINTKKIRKTEIDKDVLKSFEEQLQNLIFEICDPEIPFLEKEIPQAYGNY